MSHVPGHCSGWSAIHRDGDCRVCWQERNQETKRPGPQPGPRRSAGHSVRRALPLIDHLIRAIDCHELGDAFPNQTCGCAEKFRKCGTHGQCTKGGGRADVLCCENCDDYDPKCETPAIKLHPSMSRAALARVVEAGPQKWPAEWFGWPVTRRTMVALADRAVRNCQPAPKNLSGRGILICGGGRYEASVYVAVKMLRHVGCALPIELWHYSPTEPLTSATRALPGVTVRDAATIAGRRVSGDGWASKTNAMCNTSFAEVMFLDADAYPITDPTICFDHNPAGCVVFPDRVSDQDWHDKIQRDSYGPGIDWSKAPPPISGGQYVFDVAKCWPMLQLARHYDQFHDYWYEHKHGCGGFGDQDQTRAAIAKLGVPWTMFANRCGFQRVPNHGGGIFTYKGPDGNLLFVHRAGCKFAPPGSFGKPPARCDWLPLEDVAWDYFERWRKLAGK